MAQSKLLLRKKIETIAGINKVIVAMKLIATSKYQKIFKILKKKQDYFILMFKLVNEVLNQDNHQELKSIFKDNLKNNKSVYILINSKFGFCGPFNKNLNNSLLKQINLKNDDIFTFGKKAKKFAIENKMNLIMNFEEMNDSLNYADLLLPITNIIESFKKNKYNAIYICYNEFINNLNINPILMKIWPFDKKNLQLLSNSNKNSQKSESDISEDLSINNDEKILKTITIFEPSIGEIAKNIFSYYLQIVLYGTFINSKLAENSMRKMAMDQASENAKDFLKELKYKLNKIRQNTITNEIAEIMGGKYLN